MGEPLRMLTIHVGIPAGNKAVAPVLSNDAIGPIIMG